MLPGAFTSPRPTRASIRAFILTSWGDLAGAIEEIILNEKVVGFVDVLQLLAADLHQNIHHLGAVLRIVKIVSALALSIEHALEHV